MYKISVILPCYNKEKTIGMTLDSLINQTIFKNMEIICVNDCSKDSTVERIKEYSKKHKNIKLYNNKHNKQVFETRRKGIKHAKGKYIGFLDPDDWVDKTYFQELLANAESSGADIVENISVIKWYSNTKQESAVPSMYPTLKLGLYPVNVNTINEQICGSWCTLWNRLFKAEVIKPVARIPSYEITMMEDTLILLDCCFRANTIKNIKTNAKIYYNVSNDVDHLSNNNNKNPEREAKYKNSILLVFSILDSVIIESNKYQYYDTIKNYRKAYYGLMTNEYNKLFTKKENFKHETKYIIEIYKLCEMNKLKQRIKYLNETF